MKEQEYNEMVNWLENKDFEGIASRMTPDTIRLLHAAIGMATEAGEVLDAVKKVLFYGRPVDTHNLIEELGDLDFYQEIAKSVLNVTDEEIRATNHAKLDGVRYKNGFSEEAALNRDLEKERKALEQ